MPRVILMNAVSADGRLSGFMPDMEQYYRVFGDLGPDVHLVGSGTMAANDEIPDDPIDASFEGEEGDGGILAVVDSGGRVRKWGGLRQWPFWGRFVSIGTRSTPEVHTRYLERMKVKHIIAGDHRVDLPEALEILEEMLDVDTVVMDSGGTLNGVMLRQRLVDEISIVVHPVLVGDRLVPLFKDITGGDPIALSLRSMEQLDNGLVWLRYNVFTGQ